MNNLMPVQRPDKNGKVVTRHVRTDKASASSLPRVPAPKVPAAISEAEVSPVSDKELSDATKSVQERFGGYSSHVSDNLRTLAENSPQYFREVCEDITSCTDYRAALWKMLLDTKLVRSNPRFAKSLSIHAAVLDTIAELDPDARINAKSGHQGVFRAQELMSKASKVVMGRSDATVRTFKAAVFAYWATRYDTNLTLDSHGEEIHFIAEHFDAVMERRDVIRKRKNISKDYIESVINTAPAISGGAL